jgi:uncharacterized protein (DUF433 family)
VSRVLQLLEADDELLVRTADLIVALDLHEAAGSLVSLAVRTRQVQVALAAAWFASHPAVPREVGLSARELADRIPLRGTEREAFLIRVDPSHEAHGEQAMRLKTLAWPGTGDRGGPVVLVEDGVSRRVSLTLAGRLAVEGLRVRRVPVEWSQEPPREWIDARSPLVVWSHEAVSRIQRYGWISIPASINSGPTSVADVESFISRLRGRFPAALPSLGDSDRVRESLQDRIDVELLALGSLDIRDMAFLGGGGLSTLYDLAATGKLKPMYVGRRERIPVWTFAQLVAFRTWRHIQALAGRRRRFPSSLVGQLHEYAQGQRPSELGVSGDGRLLKREAGTWADMHTGQEVIGDVLAVDKAFEPFVLGQGRVPRLLNPSTRTRVDPTLQGGTPVIAGERLSARAVAEVDRDQGRAGVIRAFPSLDELVISEAVMVGGEILAKR